MDAAKELGPGTRVVSMPCVEAFERQSAEYREEVRPRAGANRAGCAFRIVAYFSVYFT